MAKIMTSEKIVTVPINVVNKPGGSGADFLATMVEQWGPLPAMTIEASGFGAGTRELDDLPNLVQVVIGTVGSAANSLYSSPVIYSPSTAWIVR